MSHISIFNGVKEIYGRIFENREYGTSQALVIESTGEIVTIHFKTPDELIDFCKTHNIPLEDKRNEKQ